LLLTETSVTFTDKAGDTETGGPDTIESHLIIVIRLGAAHNINPVRVRGVLE
jgi:hypothetical protein